MRGPRRLLFRSSLPILSFFLSFFLPSFFLSSFLSFFLSFFLFPPSLSLSLSLSLCLSSWLSVLSPSRKWMETKPRLFPICAAVQNKLCPRPLFTVRVAPNYNSRRLVSAPIVFNKCAVPVTLRPQQTN